MSRLLRSNLDELDVYVTRIADETGIPPSHIEKDYWVTEVLRGAAVASLGTGCSVVFKGGTSLSKAHHLIQRFSEDVDLIAVLPAGGVKANDSALKAFVAGAAEVTGLTPESDQATTTRGVKRTAVLRIRRRTAPVCCDRVCSWSLVRVAERSRNVASPSNR